MRASPPHELTERLAQLDAVDPAATRLGKAVRETLPPGMPRELLSGTWLGHSLHPLMTDAVIGTWTSALLLDLLGGDRDGTASERLIGLGIAAYLPTAVTGTVDWADTEATSAGVRRMGVVHAAANSTALAFQAASLVARRRGARRGGVLFSVAAGAALGLGGYLGGHLSYARGVGVDQTVFDAGPEEWTDAIGAADLPDGEPVVATVDETPVLLVRGADGVRAIHARCSHRGCSLGKGTLDGDVIECACHGSRFRLEDGGLERGPAFSPQPAFDARERDGRVEVRRRVRA
jgi:nitrite reductase/ring-hydroxylating ferredoxin subunit/uncharacterized membrane protein